MTRALIVLIVLALRAPAGAAVEVGQTWILGSATTLTHDGKNVALRPGDRFEVLAVGETRVQGRCRRGEASVEGQIAIAALSTALTDSQFEALRAAMTTYVYSHDEAARREAVQDIGRFRHASFALAELAASRVGLLAKDPPHEAQRLTVRVGFGVEGEYYLALPRDYDPSKTYPMIVTFHGMGGDGQYYRHWYMGNGEALAKCILVSPTSPHPQRRAWWEDNAGELILAAMRATMRDYAVDPWRVYAEGFSMGGFASTFWAQTWPDRFGAIGAQATCYWRAPRDRFRSVENVRLVPAFLAVGDHDRPGNVAAFKALAADLTRLGTPHVFKLLKDTGHAFGGQEDDLLAFLLKYHRNLYPRTIAYNYYKWIAGELLPEWVYWLRIREASHQGRIEAQVRGNAISIKTERVRRFDVYLSDHLVDLDAPVSVFVNGSPVHMGRVERDVFLMLDVIRETGDRARLFSARVEVNVR
jgi:predicted esterase